MTIIKGLIFSQPISGKYRAGSYFNGLLGEFLFYNTAIDANQTDLLNNFLMAKYGVNPTANDIYAYDTNAEGDFDFNLLGVRQTPAIAIDETTYSTGVIKFSNPTTLGSGDAIVAASDLQDQTVFDTSLSDCSTTTADDLRLDATWRVDVQGTPGNIDLELDYNSLQIAGNTELNLDLLIDDNPNFTSPTRINPSEFCSTAIYQNVSFTDGDYFTFERTGIAPVTWDGTNWANGSGTSNEPTIDDQFRKLIIDGAGAILSQDAGCTCLETTLGADLDVSGFNVNIKNDISNQGSLDVSSGSLTFNGTTNQTIDFNGFSAANVALDNSNQLTLNLDPNELLEVLNVLDVTNGVLNTNGALLMFSDASDTGQIDELTGSNDINGDVIIERFIPARRAFRLLSSSVTTSTTINANWQEGATGYLNDPNSGFGTHITGVEPDPAINATPAQDGNNGFDYNPSGDASLFTFSNDNTQQWNAVSNTDTNTLTAGDAYRLMVRGDRSIDVTDNATTPTDTKLRSTGSVVRGPLTVNPALTTSGEVAMVGNPFQSIVDMETVLNTSTNLQQSFVVWDPTLGGTPTPGVPGGRGAFVTVDVTTNTSNNASSQMNKYLQPYQAAFVIATGSSPSLTFEESDKAVNESQLGVFSTQTSPHYIHMRLFDQLSFTNNDTSDDGLTIYFSPNSSNAVDTNDAPKFFNIDENLAREESSDFISIENRAMPQVDEILPLHTSQYRTTDYVIEFEVGDFPNNEVYLYDNYTNTEVELDENAINTYSFSVDQSITESVASNRFDIRFESTTLSNDDFELSGISVYPNPASDIVNINLGENSNALEQIVLYDLNGRLVFASKQNDNDIEQQIDVSNLSSGVYVLEISTVKNQYNTKVIIE